MAPPKTAAAATSPSPSPPGVHVDKQTSLLLAPPSWSSPGAGDADRPTKDDRGRPPRCRREDYLEEDVQSLLSDWTERDEEETSAGSPAASPSADDDADDDDGEGVGTGPTTTRGGRKKIPSKPKKKKWRRLQWRPKSPSAAAAGATGGDRSRPPPSPSSSFPAVPRRTSSRNNQIVLGTPSPTTSPSSSVSVTTHRSNTSSILTTRSSATQKRSNRTDGRASGRLRLEGRRANDGRGGGPDSSLGSSSSVRSGTPPLARIRRQSRRRGGGATPAGGNAGGNDPSPPPPRRALPPRHVSSPTSIGRGRATRGGRGRGDDDELDVSSITDNSLAESEGGRDDGMRRERSDDERTHVTIENMKFAAAAASATSAAAPDGNSGGPDKNSGAREKIGTPKSDDAEHLADSGCADTCAETCATTGSEILVDLKNAACLAEEVRSPNSVMGPFAECNRYAGGAVVVVSGGMNRLTSDSGNAAGSSVWDGINNGLGKAGDDDGTVSTAGSDGRRVPGPVDVDTCSPLLTPAELHNLRAMHQLGYTHLRNKELSQALAIFAEILRGQKERHGRSSLQAAVAMHNLGVVCMRTGRHAETVRLCDGAARIRVRELGKDSPDVAASLAQQGLALMELGEYVQALKSFREALRIRRRIDDDDEDDDGRRRRRNHALIVKLLNNAGCALFETDELEGSRAAFEEALGVQRELMRAGGGKGAAACGDADDADPFDVDPKVAYHAPLGIALALTNLGSIHLRLKEFDKSLVYFEEAVLIQESVLGEDHKIVLSTNESIDFVVKSKEEETARDGPAPPPVGDAGVGAARIDRIAGILPYVGRERNRRIYARAHRDISAAIDAVSSARCDRRPFACAVDERSFAA